MLWKPDQVEKTEMSRDMKWTSVVSALIFNFLFLAVGANFLQLVLAKKTFEYSTESHSFTVVKSSFLGDEPTWAALDIFLGLVFAYLL